MVFSAAWGWLSLMPLFLLVLSLLALFFERRFIALAQKRLGITFLGRNGWAHLPADLVKFWLKQSYKAHGSWLGAQAGLTGAIFAYLCWSLLTCLFFLTDGRAAATDGWDYQLLALCAYAGFTTLFMAHLVAGLRSKYAQMAAARVLLVSVLMEVTFLGLFMMLYVHAGGYGLEDLAAGPCLAAALPPLALAMVLFCLFEAKRPPFDHSEAESELVAGHLVEFGGRALLFFYMCEYVHMFACAYLLLTVVLGAL
jgi:NADH-quinone oxidoreductase subunit H